MRSSEQKNLIHNPIGVCSPGGTHVSAKSDQHLPGYSKIRSYNFISIDEIDEKSKKFNDLYTTKHLFTLKVIEYQTKIFIIISIH